ncbi:MAG: hypothetical protein AAGB97_07285, partial [Dehalococcoidia bacterium]
EGEGGGVRRAGSPRRTQTPPSSGQLPLFVHRSPVLEELERLDIDSLSPLEAITKLYDLRKKAREG